MTYEEAYRAGWDACMTYKKCEQPVDLTVDEAAAWRLGFVDAMEAPLGTRIGERAADYYEGDRR